MRENLEDLNARDPRISRETARRIGYVNAEFGFDCNTCSVICAVDEPSPEDAQGRRRRL